MAARPAIYYLVPDHAEPSWGIGMLYHHVRLLREAGHDAIVVHERRGFRPGWLEVEVPAHTRRQAARRMTASDLLVVPEVRARDPWVLASRARRVVFVQGSFLILVGDGPAFSYRDLGYEAAFAAMPHVHAIIEAHFGLTPLLVPPFVAPYFFVERGELSRARPRRVLLVGKPAYRTFGYPDHDIVARLLTRAMTRDPALRDWRLERLEGLTHRAVAETMRGSSVVVNVNTLEGFNVTVPEAMAAGCVVVCYEAFGGQDYLEPDANALVYPNNHAYPLTDGVLDLLTHFDGRGDALLPMRRRALETAHRFGETETARALVASIESLI